MILLDSVNSSLNETAFVVCGHARLLNRKHVKVLEADGKRSTPRAPCHSRTITSLIDMGSTKSRTPTSNAKLWANLNLDASTLVSAKFLSSPDQIRAVWSQRDVVASRKRIFSTVHTVSRDNEYITAPPVELRESPSPSIFLSPSRKKFLKFATPKLPSGKPDNVTSIEIWTMGGGLDSSWEVDDSTHGVVYTDEWFGSVSWSPDESMVVYVADRPEPESPKSDDPQESWAHPLHFKFHENARGPFGEAYQNRRSPTLFIADLVDRKTYLICTKKMSKEETLFGEPQWSPDGKFIAATMRWRTFVDADLRPQSDECLPNDLGLRYCYNRYSSIVVFVVPQAPTAMSSKTVQMKAVSSKVDAEDFCCNSPRFSPDSKDLIYLSSPRYGAERANGRVLPHNSTRVLRYVRISEDGISDPCTLIPVPEDPSSTGFPGLYLHSLIEYPWLNANSIVLNSVWGSVNKVMTARFTRKDQELTPNVKPVTALAFDAGNGETGIPVYSYNVLDNLDNVILVSASNPASPTRFSVVHLENGNDVELQPKFVTALSPRAQALEKNVRGMHTIDLVTTGTLDESFSGSAIRFIPEEHEASLRFQVTVLLPRKTAGKSPLIVYPHGGPHVATLNGYTHLAMALLKCGYGVMYVNYRGSLGLGQKSLETLPGNVGRQDVNEVVQATRWALSEADFGLDTDRVGFLGGSHSGFLGAHTSLIPGLYKRTVLRNPVTNIAMMVGATDIPDWCFCEAGLNSRNENGVQLAPDAEQLRKMYALSPVSRVKACASEQRPGPTLLQVGGSDRRVPPQQSLEWKRIMTEAYGSGNVTIRWYPKSGHAIDEVPNGDDAAVQALDFFRHI